jgi:hypothetical protein
VSVADASQLVKEEPTGMSLALSKATELEVDIGEVQGAVQVDDAVPLRNTDGKLTTSISSMFPVFVAPPGNVAVNESCPTDDDVVYQISSSRQLPARQLAPKFSCVFFAKVQVFD